MRLTQYLETPYPEGGDVADLADVPRQLRDIAYSWENSFGGIWLDWIPNVTQGSSGAPAPLGVDTTTSVCRVKKLGKTVYVQARIDISAGNGISGYPIISLPYPYVNPYVPVGMIGSRVGAATFYNMGRNYGFSGATSFFADQGFVMAFDQPTPRVATDWFELLLRYETV